MQRFIKIMISMSLLFFMGCSISVDVETIDFGTTETTKTFELKVVGRVKWTITASENWVTVSPNQGQSTEVVEVSINREGLDKGNYTAVLSIDSKLKKDTQFIVVKMTVEEQTPNPTVVEGYVFDANTDNPLSGVIVSIGANSFPSNIDGYYIVDAGTAGQKTITAVKDGYENFSEQIDVVSGTNQLDIYMTPIGSTTTTQPTTTTTQPTTTTTQPTTTTTQPTTTTTQPTTTTTQPTTTTTQPTTTTTQPTTTTTTIGPGKWDTMKWDQDVWGN